MKRARADRATATAKETRVTATMVAVMMANSAKDSVRPYNNQLRGSDDNNSKGKEEDEGSKGDGDGGYNDNVDKRDHGVGNDGKWQRVTKIAQVHTAQQTT